MQSGAQRCGSAGEEVADVRPRDPVPLPSGRTGEVIRPCNDALLAPTEEQPGCRRMLLLTAPRTDRALALTRWATAAELAAGSSRSAPGLGRAMADRGRSPHTAQSAAPRPL